MTITLDGQKLFDQQQLRLEAGSVKRDSIEKSAAGLDGVVSIDLGSRGRKIKQTGVLRANSSAQMTRKLDAISAYMDGQTHTLISDSSESFENMRMDSFKVINQSTDSSGLVVSYEIIYTQLAV